MAFIDFSGGLAYTMPSTQSGPAVTALFSPLERSVIALAREDRAATLRPAREYSWLARLVFGPPPPSPTLANERLEALRRLAVMAWRHGHQLPASALREAQYAGYSKAQTAALIDLIDALRAPVGGATA